MRMPPRLFRKRIAMCQLSRVLLILHTWRLQSRRRSAWGPFGDLREKQGDSYSSGMQEDYNAHDAARAAAGADNAGAAAAKYIQTLGPLSEREALKGMQP